AFEPRIGTDAGRHPRLWRRLHGICRANGSGSAGAEELSVSLAQLTRNANRVKAGSITSSAMFRAESFMRGLLLAFLALTSSGTAGGSRARLTKTSAKTKTATAV